MLLVLLVWHLLRLLLDEVVVSRAVAIVVDGQVGVVAVIVAAVVATAAAACRR